MMEDPFFVVKDEVFKALNKTRGLYLRWRELNDAQSSDTTAEADWTTTELKNSLRSIEWDLEDLEDTISIVEKNPNKFKIDNKELSSRRHFIDATRNEVKSMKDRMSINRNRDRDITARQPLLDNSTNGSPNNQVNKNFINNNCIIGTGSNGTHIGSGIGCHLNNNNLNLTGTGKQLISSAGAAMAASRHSGAKYSKLENNLDDSPTHYAPSSSAVLDSGSSRFLEDTLVTQQRILATQDEQLDVISDSIGTLKTVSRQIGIELDEQAVMLDEFGNELEQTESKLDSTMKKMAKVLHMTNDRRQWMAIVVLSIALVVVIIFYIIL
ncbi:syntaxin-10 isoform X1 [Sabethes cyaneus]|uniref:syntaxin-10 isoform X1 n=1 Tax=Sabethes cyaneus TaxID=53552 RepID=UPI00237EBB9D|nr:syntaxin-10 isoform X1 [Sabethes cyaneus]XP_053684196.1 syntaxin-10 isoform X1 [Sabethes cyaneus]XP_053684197.1 syntaxin-10 isoform X1 [Sabethes cyaneus]